jgi:hypothetical protein
MGEPCGDQSLSQEIGVYPRKYEESLAVSWCTFEPISLSPRMRGGDRLRTIREDVQVGLSPHTRVGGREILPVPGLHPRSLPAQAGERS